MDLDLDPGRVDQMITLGISEFLTVIIPAIIPNLQGLPITTARPYHVLQAILRAQKRLNREFSDEEIETGKVGPLLTAEDFNIESYVSTHRYQYTLVH